MKQEIKAWRCRATTSLSRSYTFGEVSAFHFKHLLNFFFFILDDYYGQLGVGSEKVIHNLPKVCSFNIVVTDASCGDEHTVFV